MFNGTNPSGKLFDVINEDNEVIGSFDDRSDMIACALSAHWSQGECTVRRDQAISDAQHLASRALPSGLIGLARLT